MSGREAILSALPAAQDATIPNPFEVRSPELAHADLWALFEERLVDLGGRVIGESKLGSLSGLLASVDQGLEALAERIGLKPIREVWESEVGLTLAEVAVAESGSVLVSCGPGRPRLGSLAPPKNVLVVPRTAIVATLEEGLARLSERTSVLITGPSRTADIEGVLVRGVHGPGELWVLPIES